MFKPSNRRAILSFLEEDDAATAVEYAVMLALIIAVCMASVTFLADKTRDSFNSSGAAISGAWGN
jgi:pilus assembly protein Flp/PilA